MLLNLQTQLVAMTLASLGCTVSSYADRKGEHYTIERKGVTVFIDICTTARTLYSVRLHTSAYADYFGYDRNKAIAETKRLLGL